jgi:hypothetical protein
MNGAPGESGMLPIGKLVPHFLSMSITCQAILPKNLNWIQQPLAFITIKMKTSEPLNRKLIPVLTGPSGDWSKKDFVFLVP